MRQPPPYKVRRIHVVAKSGDMLVREYTLDGGEFIPWHHHNSVTHYYYGWKVELWCRRKTRQHALKSVSARRRQ